MKFTKEELIGSTAQIARNVTIIDAKQAEDGSWDIYVSCPMSGNYWTELDDTVSLD